VPNNEESSSQFHDHAFCSLRDRVRVVRDRPAGSVAGSAIRACHPGPGYDDHHDVRTSLDDHHDHDGSIDDGGRTADDARSGRDADIEHDSGATIAVAGIVDDDLVVDHFVEHDIYERRSVDASFIP
jgi:hypothetical protein